MLIAIFTIFFLGGGTAGFMNYIADSRDMVKEVVVDGEHRDAALETLKAMKGRVKDFNKDIKGTAKDLGKLLEGGEATSEQIDAIWAVHVENYDAYTRDILDLRFALKGDINREEWAKIFAAEQR